MAECVYWVKADHSCSKYVYDGMMTARQDLLTGLWYVNQFPYGCSRNYERPEQAVRELMLHHGCENLSIVILGYKG